MTADRLLDWNGGIEPRRAVDVDVVGAEALQRIGEEVLGRGWPRVQSDEVAGGTAQRAELHADLHFVARDIFQRLAHQHLIVTHGVEIAGVEQRDAGIERGVNRGDALAAIGGAIDLRHAHAAEAEGGDVGAGRTEFALFHDGSPRKGGG